MTDRSLRSADTLPVERTISDPSAFPAAAKATDTGTKAMIVAIWTVIRAFFVDPVSSYVPKAMGVAVMVMVFVVSFVHLWFMQTVGDLQNALHNKKAGAFYHVLQKICIACVLMMPVSALRDGLKGSLALEWRRFLTHKLIRGYIGDSQAYYRLKVLGGVGRQIDNPDQRIGQDVGQLVFIVLSFLITVAQALVNIVLQSIMMLTIDVHLLMFVFAYSVGMNVVTFGIFGQRLTVVNRTTLAQEASLRFGMVRVRENAEPIAFYRGAMFEQSRCLQYFAELIRTLYWKLVLSVSLESLLAGMSLLIGVLPYAIVAERYFRGDLDFGSLTRAAMVLGTLERAFEQLVNQIEGITNMGAQAMRVRQLADALDSLERQSGGFNGMSDDQHDPSPLLAPHEQCIGLDELPVSASAAPGCMLLRIDALTLRPPCGQAPLVADLSFELRVGDSLILSGPSGIGKSSVLRAIGGLWASGHGDIQRCAAEQSFFVPQEPYLCLGTLRDNCTYPGQTSTQEQGVSQEPSDFDIRSALGSVSLEYLLERFGLDECVDLDTVLSGGEKQRLGFARLLLRPNGVRFALLDEATSALDQGAEDAVYRLLRQEVLSYVSVGHRANLDNYHTHKLLLER
eukprot:CAMPEP_0198523836 /NCGR_PEP_ID=MMETSP1462-20131121/22386_1 /TAXON_ID=1333877 /ORGANISM="Brandtodinium nutriculum, Strain RCC3387" /LENGTH=623 /DNA_ID=CAMNT_0044253545 /DNA_START=126 /DNA_END=1994 /DNA_ORIENTATION=+